MKKYLSRAILAVVILAIICGCSKNNHPKVKREEVKETMNPSVYVDPAVDLSSDQIISVIVEFKPKPAKVAVIEAEAKGIPFTLAEAEKQVEESHLMFQKELHEIFDKNQIPYTVRNKYTTALNGVSMELPANEIKRLAESSSVISKVSVNRKVKLNPPPILPFEQL
ncbi:protease inhibitor I9 family protein [Bacillus sp. X1(2014)]|uniref:protease inhibitor I9 family protein n=1 Tax=Bacillus sp. X1(2014) TaxID=1565991 RepID=UPI00119F0B96|nr:protease inhibitor I9 family protein [Bacillus sp. X1(2014)]